LYTTLERLVDLDLFFIIVCRFSFTTGKGPLLIVGNFMLPSPPELYWFSGMPGETFLITPFGLGPLYLKVWRLLSLAEPASEAS